MIAERLGKVFDYSLNGRSQGFLTLLPWNDGWFVCRLYVNPEFRDQGVATALMTRVLDDYGPFYLQPEAWADAPLSNDDLGEWYQSLGFEPGNVGGDPVWRHPGRF